MKKFVSLVLLLMGIFSTSAAFATSIGYIDFKKVGAEYYYAKNAYKEIDNKYLDLQQYSIEAGKQYKTIESPIAKKNFEEKTQKDFAQKREALENLQMQKEEEIYNRVIEATKVVANEKRLDAVFDKNAVFVGGMDITDDVIRRLNAQGR